MRRKGRSLTKEEESLWKKIADKNRPLSRHKQSEVLPLNTSIKLRSDIKPSSSLRLVGQNQIATSWLVHPGFSKKGERVSPRMDKKNFNRLRKGKFEIEASLDLHGMTQDRAFDVLHAFINRSFQSEKRLVLVITGKGSKTDVKFWENQRGVLKELLPRWLAHPSLSSKIVEVTEAQQKDGGAGAYYIYLKRKR